MNTDDLINDLLNAGLSGKYGKETAEARWVRIWVRDKFHCVYCGADLLSDLIRMSSCQIDHLLPRSKYKQYDNKESDSNLVLSCFTCNQIKRAFDPLTKLSEEERTDVIQGHLENHKEKIIDVCRNRIKDSRRKKEEILDNSVRVLKNYGFSINTGNQ
jgi:hypothetical protein